MDWNTFIFDEVTMPSGWKKHDDEIQDAFYNPNQADGMQADNNGLKNANEENDIDPQPNYHEFSNNFMIDVVYWLMDDWFYMRVFLYVCILSLKERILFLGICREKWFVQVGLRSRERTWICYCHWKVKNWEEDLCRTDLWKQYKDMLVPKFIESLKNVDIYLN